MPGLLCANFPSCLPNGFTFSFDSLLQKILHKTNFVAQIQLYFMMYFARSKQFARARNILACRLYVSFFRVPYKRYLEYQWVHCSPTEVTRECMYIMHLCSYLRRRTKAQTSSITPQLLGINVVVGRITSSKIVINP